MYRATQAQNRGKYTLCWGFLMCEKVIIRAWGTGSRVSDGSVAQASLLVAVGEKTPAGSRCHEETPAGSRCHEETQASL